MKPYIETLRNVIIGSNYHLKGAILEVGTDLTTDQARAVLSDPNLAVERTDPSPLPVPVDQAEAGDPVVPPAQGDTARPFNRKTLKTWRPPKKG
jgi:hypothetical protein